MSDLQKFYDEKMTQLTPLLPIPGRAPSEYAGAMQAFLTCAVDIARRCYQLPEEQCKWIVQDAYTFIGERMKHLADERN